MHADPIDNASETEAVLLAASIAGVRKNKPIEAEAHCLSCGTALVQDAELPRRWCDAECRDDWERGQR
jgi:hypothetical protein